MNQEKLKLPRVTLAAMTSVKLYGTIKALEYSMQGIEYGEVVLITDKRPKKLPAGITCKHIDKLDNIDKFNYSMVYELTDYITTDYVMLIHYDGFVINPDKWRDEFYDYDYIGSPWPMPDEKYQFFYDINGNPCRVGNSVSLRSKRLLDFPRKAKLPWRPMADGTYNEDAFLCCMNKHLIEAAGMKIAPIEVARYFAHEHLLPETQGIVPFAFHKWWGENVDYPRFEDPKAVRIAKIKNRIRPLLFWRRFKRK